ncbi:tail fiber/spike domain-containing protein [Klebsiella pneumoniae]
MARIPESSLWEEEIELISRSERVSGGLDGVANRPLKALANRTRYLKGKVDKAGELVAEKVSAVKTFAEGATLESPREEILYGAYRLVWTGEFPKTVLAGSTPQGTGGVGAGRWAYTSDAVIRKDLGSSEPGMGDDLVFTKYGISVGEYIRNSPVRLSNYKITSGTDVTTAFSVAANLAALSKKLFLVDVDCLISSVTLPGDLTMEIMPGKAISQLPGSGLKMLIAGGDNILIKSDGTGRLIGQEALQGGINYGFWAEGVTSPRLEGVDVGHFKGFGAYFSNCTRPACIRSTVHDITGGYVETACGIYFTNCIEPYSERNMVTDVGANGIKFRADTLGQTVRGKSVGDRVYRAGYIGIANSKCAHHVVEDYYCEDCGDNGADMNGCYDTQFKNGTSVNCLDGAYVGENNLNLCKIINQVSINCRRSAVGSMGAATNVLLDNLTGDGCGSGVYCSGFTVFKIRGGQIINSVKRAYLDNHDGQTKQSTGHGIHIQSDLTGLPACTNPDFQGVTFLNNAGYDLALGDAGVIGSLQFMNNTFLDNAGDGKIYYGSATLGDPIIGNNIGYITSRTQAYNLAGDGTTVEFTLYLPQEVTDANYRIVSVVPDWLTTVRYLDNVKGTSYFGITFGSAPPAGTRRVNISFERLRPAH